MVVGLSLVSIGTKGKPAFRCFFDDLRKENFQGQRKTQSAGYGDAVRGGPERRVAYELCDLLLAAGADMEVHPGITPDPMSHAAFRGAMAFITGRDFSFRANPEPLPAPAAPIRSYIKQGGPVWSALSRRRTPGSYTLVLFHRPFLNRIKAATVIAVSATGIAINTPLGPRSKCRDST